MDSDWAVNFGVMDVTCNTEVMEVMAVIMGVTEVMNSKIK
jgi:hypothetical protein